MIDEKLIALHQWIVDETERQPAWWVEQTAWAFIAADLAAIALDWKGGADIVIAALVLLMGASLIYISRTPARLAATAANGMPWRMLFLALVAYKAYAVVLTFDVSRAANLLATTLLTSCNYFAACKPPRPRKRRQAIPQGGAA